MHSFIMWSSSAAIKWILFLQLLSPYSNSFVLESGTKKLGKEGEKVIVSEQLNDHPSQDHLHFIINFSILYVCFSFIEILIMSNSYC